ncbi:MAG: flagellar motor switch protein FliG [Deltaproteobacteria bacterium CG11_big_fil_rev_8_21_14_0_20_45_16]|nr:MAG: flagellar motor switch protein FliG [Deltaproteobacteria bacterium CG11_big_fil_rev_8_21_14_0_20_45_16]
MAEEAVKDDKSAATNKAAAIAAIRLRGTQKAAALLLSVDKSISKKVFQRLEDFEVKKITDAMFELGVIHQDTTTNILNEFVRNVASGGAISTSTEEIKALLSETLDEKRASEIISSMTSFKDNTLKNLGTYDPKTLANFLSNEHPQTIAVLLCHMGPEKVGQVVRLLPENVQSEVIMRIAFLEEITPEALGDIEEAVKEALKGLGSATKHKMGGVEYVADALNRLDKRTTSSILEAISADNAELAEEIKQNMFVFEDLINVDDRGVQEILKNVDTGELALALKVCTDDLKERIFSNMSERAAKILREDLDVMGPVKVSDVERAQGNILKVVDRLVSEGKVVLSGEGEEAVV